MATARKLPSGNWRVNLYIGKDADGKRIYKSFTASTRREAERDAAMYAASEKASREPRKLTVWQAIKQYISSKSNILSPSTIRGYKIMLDNAYKDIESVQVRAITNQIVQAWANGNAAKYSPKSLKNQYGLLVSALAQQGVSVGKVSLKPPVKIDYLVPDKRQMAAIIKAVDGTSVEIPVLLALMLGLRQSEIAALKWENYTGKTIYVHGAVVPNSDNKYIEKPENKSIASTRTLDVPEYLARKLDAIKKPSGHISEMLPSSVLRKFYKICDASGLPRFKMHALRHANASVMLMQGIPDKYAMERLGQLTPSMIKRVYQHTFDDEQRNASAKVDDAFKKICNTKCNTEK